MSTIHKDVQDLQKRIEMKNRQVKTANQERDTFKQQYEKLFEDMKKESDSESAEEIDMKAMIIELQ